MRQTFQGLRTVRRVLLAWIKTFFSTGRGRETLRRSAHYILNYVSVHQAIVGLTLFILINNALAVRAANVTPTLPVGTIISDPYQIGDTVRLLSDYTPNIDENPDAIALALEEHTNGSFIKTNPLIATEPGQFEESSPVPTPSPSQVAQERTKDTKYTVQIGDTLSGISTKFGLKVASVKVKNNLSDVDSIKPGQELLVPAQDLSQKAVQAADDRKKASQTLAQQSGKDKAKVISAPSKGFGLIVPLSHNGISRGLVGGHTGIDYRANIGTPTWAAADGVVVIADNDGWNGGYGKTVLLDIGGGKTLRYGHLSQVNVHAGQVVHRGDGLGKTGNTGRSTGPHLHFELRVNGVARNPFP